MKKLLTILLIACAQTIIAQDYTAQWTVSNESNVQNYQVQQSLDNKTWTSLAQISKGKSVYSYTVPAKTAWIRIKGVGGAGYYSKSVYMSVDPVYSSSITNATFHNTSGSDKLTWQAKEQNVSYYLIEKWVNKGPWTTVTKFNAKGGGSYSYTLKRLVSPVGYRVHAVYKNSTSGTIINFNYK